MVPRLKVKLRPLGDSVSWEWIWLTIESQDDLRKLRAIGKIVRETLDEMSSAVRPGMTTYELDQVGAQVLARNGAESSPPKVYGFPGTACISVNEEVVHGIPGSRKLEEGDIVKIDVTADKDGYVADAAVTVEVGRVSPQASALASCARTAFCEALRVAKAGTPIREIGRAVETEVKRSGFTVIEELCGHGVGRTIHESPSVLNYFDPHMTGMLTDGLVITIEPIISAGRGQVRTRPDKWTIFTADGSLAAHYEHTIVITRDKPIVITGDCQRLG
jgi:methionyl aminopeptidase